MKQLSILDYTSTKHAVNREVWNKRKRRMYGRLKSGVVWARSNNEQLYFLTLTTRYDKNKGFNEVRFQELGVHFQNLVKRLRRKYGKFEYCRVKTREGSGVLHILFKGSRINIKIVREAWKELHYDSKIMRIIKCYGRTNVLIKYLVGYFIHHSYTRLSWSKGWVFPKFVTTMKALIELYGFSEGIRKWKLTLIKQIPLSVVQKVCKPWL